MEPSTTLLVLGVISLGLSVVHLGPGGKQCAQPLLEAPLGRVSKLTLYACWHFVSVHLLVGGLALVWIGLAPGPLGRGIAAALAASWLGIAAIFLVLVATSGVRGGWYRLGQWIAFLPMGIAGLLAVT